MKGAEPGGHVADPLGRPVRRFPVAVSAEAQALAWARQEGAPHGAAVVVDHEVSPRGRAGRVWWAPAETTLACALVLRPALSAEEGDAVWLAGGLAVARAAEAVVGRPVATWWPDLVVDPATGQPVATVKAEVQLGPGEVRSAVVTLRFDLERLGIDAARRDDLLEALLEAFEEAELGDGAAVAAVYERRCRLVGERVKVTLRPKGETRGVASRVDGKARLVLESPTGMVERIAVDTLGDLELVS